MTPTGKTTLCLDLGTHTGFAIGSETITESGTLTLATPQELLEQKQTGKERTRDIRVLRLADFIQENIQKHQIQRIVFEDVSFNTSQYQAQLWASLRTAIWLASEQIEIQCVPVKTLKLFATGNGNAKKENMLAALLQHNMTFTLLDDNQVDALWLLKYTQAVDKGLLAWSSIWQNKQLAKEAKKKKLEAKRKKGQLALEVRAKELQETLAQITAKLPKADIKKLAKKSLLTDFEEPIKQYTVSYKKTRKQRWQITSL